MSAGFNFKERLGAGHFGEVWLAEDTGLRQDVALKLIQPSKLPNSKNFFQEAQLLKGAEHPNVVKVYETGPLNDGRIYVSMEYLPSGSLEDEAKGRYVELTRAKRIMIDVLRGLEHAHSKGILHRDIKPANILIGNNKEGKLSDFGQAVPKNINPALLGAKDYAYILHLAPEVHGGKPFSIQTDIFACGMTIYRLVNGDMYLPSLPAQDVIKASIAGKYPDRAVHRNFVPRAWRSFISKALALSLKERFRSAEEMRHALERLPAAVNWQERLLPDGMRWATGLVQACWVVEKTRDSAGRWCVEVRKGRNKNNLGRVLALCKYGLVESRADQFSRKVLQGFVTGKYP